MNIGLAGLVAILLAAVGWAQPAGAQGAPQGTYRGTCSNIDLRGGALTATIDVPHTSKHPEIWATSPFDAYHDVVVEPAKE